MADITDRDRRLVDQYLHPYLCYVANVSTNSAVADNMKRAAEAMVAIAREEGAVEAHRLWQSGALPAHAAAVAETEPHG